MQPLTINATQSSSLLTLTLGYGTASDLHAAFRAGHVPHRNGNILAQTISVGGWSVQQHYRYDQLNRLSIVSEKAAPGGSAPNFSCPTSGTGVWRREYGYDRYGNRAATGTLQLTSATPASTSVYVSSSNRLIGTWATYDAAGNLTVFKNPGGTSHGRWTAGYDGENKQRYYCAAVTTPCTAAVHDVEYVYDGEGNRVLKEVTNGAATTYVYDAFGRLAAEYKLGGPTEEAGTFYRTTDHLGSTRLVTDSSGAVVSRRDFFPFGEQIDADASSGRAGLAGYNAPIGFPQLFTAKERDTESGLDYFLARYYGSSLGRFNSVDPGNAGADPLNPQSGTRTHM